MQISELEKKARWVRLQVLDSIVRSKKSHIGGTYSCTDLLVALYYGNLLRFNAKNLSWHLRDRFILSKGHACTALYAIFFDLKMMSRRTYDSYGSDGGLGGQLETYLPGVDFNTGSIGHSVGVAAGMAQAAKIDRKNYRAMTIIGDSELFEGSIWEAIIWAGTEKIHNLIVIVDRNRLMVTDTIDDDGLYNNIEKKMEYFGWAFYRINGHDFHEIMNVFRRIEKTSKPVLIMADTIKGKGVSFMENNIKWHNALPSPEEISAARKELMEQL